MGEGFLTKIQISVWQVLPTFHNICHMKDAILLKDVHVKKSTLKVLATDSGHELRK